MWIGLTGSPKVASVEYAGQAEASGRAEPEHVVSVRRGGLEVVLEERYRPVGEVTWVTDEGTALALQSDIGLTCRLSLRARRDGDPSWGTALSLDVRRTSDAELSAPLSETWVATGRPVATVRFRWRALATYTLVELGLGPIGGFDLISQTGVGAIYAPYGTATATEVPFAATFLGVSYNLTGYVLGDGRVVAARVVDVDATSAQLRSREAAAITSPPIFA